MFNPLGSKSGMIVHSQDPYNAEPPLGRLREAYLTAQANFYIRTHGDIPLIDEGTHRLRVDGLVATPLDLSMPELLDRFPRRSVVAVMQCAGNRRADMQQVRPTSGDPWAPGAIGNAEWTGVALADVLRAAGASEEADLYVAFACCDTIEMEQEGCFNYGVSIPMAKALSSEVLLAVAMNGEPLAPEHGSPLRVVVPGFAGVRSPKWLACITVQAEPSDNPMQQRDYKLLPADVTEATVDWSKGITINNMPLNSAICEPASLAEVRAGAVELKGYAVATARAIVRVDVSSNGGRSWSQAELERNHAPAWCWSFWQATLDIPAGEHELAVRAWDSAGQTQPALPDDTWNFKGYLCAGWHRIRIKAA